jgi:5-(carboxyamino)imidazole ribonucleotide synthase
MLRVGILGGGQLGRMLLQAAANYPVETWLMEKEEDCPAAHLCHHFVKGDIRDFDQVYQFGKGLDALTIEIESVNEGALEKLEAEGVKVYPRAAALSTIKDKIRQKQFYKAGGIPTAEFLVTNSLEELQKQGSWLPAVHKVAAGGYDGRGVRILRMAEDLNKGFNEPAVLEKLVNIDKEIAQMVAINEKGETAIYPPVEMIFNASLNLLDYQISPADLPQQTLWKIEAISLRVVKDLKSPGIFAVEFLVSRQGEVFVNETAPRVHNSGHHTIEGNFSSQFDMLWRVILGYPLGNTESILPGAIVNLIGEAGHQGEAHYEGLDEVLQMDNVFVHIYGKRETRAGRKMGHVTILSKEKQELVHKAHRIRQALKIVSKS